MYSILGSVNRFVQPITLHKYKFPQKARLRLLRKDCLGCGTGESYTWKPEQYELPEFLNFL